MYFLTRNQNQIVNGRSFQEGQNLGYAESALQFAEVTFSIL